MTITLYLSKFTLLRDIQTLTAIKDAKIPEIASKLSTFLQPLNISLTPRYNPSVAIQVTMEEFALIGCFQPSITEN